MFGVHKKKGGNESAPVVCQERVERAIVSGNCLYFLLERLWEWTVQNSLVYNGNSANAPPTGRPINTPH